MMSLKRNFSLICLSVISIGILSSCGNKNEKITYEFTYYDGHSINVDVPKDKKVEEYYPANTPKHDDGYHEYTYTWNLESEKKYKEKQNDTKISSLYTFTFYDKHTQQVDVPRDAKVEDYFPSNTPKHDDGFKEYTYSWEKSQTLNYIEKQSSTKISKDFIFEYADGSKKTVEVPKNGKVEDYFPKDHSETIYDKENRIIHYYYGWALSHDNVYIEVSEDINVYRVTYVMIDGAKNPSENPAYAYYATHHTLLPATCDGYTFDGWFTDPEYQTVITEISNPTKDLTLYAKFTPIVYTITYNLNGGINSPNNPDSYVVTDNEIVLENPTKEDCSFDGWYEDSTFKTKIEKIDCKKCKNVTLYAKFSPTTYTITYYLDGGTNPKTNPATYTYYDEITFAEPTKNGYTFDGWYEDYSFSTPITGLKKSKGNKELFAKYTRNVYTITYHTDGGTAPLVNPTSYTVDDTITLADSEKTGYTFKGWYEDSSFKTKIATVSNRYENLNLYAKFEVNNYTITFHLSEASFVEVNYNYYASVSDIDDDRITSKTISYSPTSFNPYQFAADNKLHGFEGWNIKNVILNTNKIYVVLKSIQYNIFKKYSQFTDIVHYYSDEDFNVEVSSPHAYPYGMSKRVYLYIPKYYSSTDFEYKMHTDGESGDSCTEVRFTKNGGATGVFNKNLRDKKDVSGRITVEFDSRMYEFTPFLVLKVCLGSELHFTSSKISSLKKATILSSSYDLSKLQIGIDYDSNVAMPIVERYGYNFVNWKDNDGNIYKSGIWKTLHDVDLYPTWSTIQYDIDYKLNGGINNPDNPNSYNIETETFSLKVPTRAGYDFAGWFEDEKLTKSISVIEKGSYGNKVLYAKWSNASYKLTLNPSGGVIKPKINFYDGTSLLETQIVGSADKVNYLVPNDKQGFIFTGWYEDKACTILHDFSKTITNSTNLYAGWFEYQGSYEPVVNPVRVGDTFNNVTINGVDKENIFAFSPLVDTSITISSDSLDKSLYSVAKLYDYLDGAPSLVCESSYKSESDLNFTLTCNIKAGHVYYLIVNGKYTTSIGTISILFGGTYLPDTNYGTTYTDSTSYNVTYDKDYLLMDVTKDGSTFVGWFDENDNEYTEGTWKTAKDVVLHAKWN